MQRRLFLTGSSGNDRSATIINALGAKLKYAGGYMTLGAKNEFGGIEGVDLMPAAAAADISGLERARILSFENGALVHNNEVFREVGVRLLQEAQYYPFAVLDEFGGFDLIIPQFREALLEVLNSDLPCIGVMMSEAEGENLRTVLGLGEKYTAFRRALKTALENNADTLILDVDSEDDDEIIGTVQCWINEYAV